MLKKYAAFFLTICLPFYLFSQIEETIPPEYISTVQFSGNTAQSQLPILRLGENVQMSFDVLNGLEEDYYYSITHYNFDWTPSDLSKGEFLVGFDETRIEHYENSFNTLTTYSHYTLFIPNRDTRGITKSGNYLLSILDDEGNLIFSRKFMVIENIAGVTLNIKRSRDLKIIDYMQVVQMVISSPNLLLINPKQTVKTIIMQNSNLKTAITNLTPQYTVGNELIYRYDKEAAFGGGNEFLSFDNKDVRSAVYGVRRVELTDIYENYLFTNTSRKNRPYSFNGDINGNFVIRNLDVQNSNIEAEYVRMFFKLQYFEDLGDREIHIYGNFNNWTIDSSTYMRYDEASDTYGTSRLFKQGYHDYKYVIVNRDGTIDQNAICGNFWQTENDYTVLVYYRELGGRYDRIIGMGQANSRDIHDN